MVEKLDKKEVKEEVLLEKFTLNISKVQNMRYGENKHQLKAAFYSVVPRLDIPCIANYIQYQGKQLSFNNILDADAAIETIKEFQRAACVIIKHSTPCGMATATTIEKAWQDALAADTYSPIGGIVAFNREVTSLTLKEIARAREKYGIWLEVLIAPSYNSEAQRQLAEKKNLRVLVVEGLDKPFQERLLELRMVTGGCLVQEKDTWLNDKKNWKVVTDKKPSEKDFQSMDFAVKCIKHIKSNSVLFVKGTRAIAIGGGQTSRIDAIWIATHKGKESIKGSIMISDGFLPFKDNIDAIAKHEVRAIIQPGGSIRDEEVIQAANEQGIIMVFSGQRYFKH